MQQYLEAKENGDTNLQNKIFEKIILESDAITNKLINTFWKDSGHESDLIQEGRLATFHALNKFDITQGSKFVTYAYTCIRNSLFLYMKKNRNPFGEVNNTLTKEDLDIAIQEMDKANTTRVNNNMSPTTADSLSFILSKMPAKHAKTIKVWNDLEVGEKPTSVDKVMAQRSMKKVVKKYNISISDFRNTITDSTFSISSYNYCFKTRPKTI